MIISRALLFQISFEQTLRDVFGVCRKIALQHPLEHAPVIGHAEAFVFAKREHDLSFRVARKTSGVINNAAIAVAIVMQVSEVRR